MSVIDLPEGSVAVSAVVFWSVFALSLGASGCICLGTCKGGLYPHPDTARGGRGVPHRNTSLGSNLLYWQLPIIAGFFLGFSLGGVFGGILGVVGTVYALFLYSYTSSAPESMEL